MFTTTGIRKPKTKLRSSLHLPNNYYQRSIKIARAKESIGAFLDWVSDIVRITNKPAQILLQNNLTKDLMSVSVSLEKGRTFGGYSSTFLGAFRKASHEMFKYWEQTNEPEEKKSVARKKNCRRIGGKSSKSKRFN